MCQGIIYKILDYCVISPPLPHLICFLSQANSKIILTPISYCWSPDYMQWLTQEVSF